MTKRTGSGWCAAWLVFVASCASPAPAAPTETDTDSAADANPADASAPRDGVAVDTADAGSSAAVDVLDANATDEPDGFDPDASDAPDIVNAGDAVVPPDAIDSTAPDAARRDASNAADAIAADVPAAADALDANAPDAPNASHTDVTAAPDRFAAADAADARDAATADTADVTHVPDPCATANGGCDPLTACANAGGAPRCSACPAGYSGTGATRCTWNDPSLSTLGVSAGTLSPAFTGATTSYEITVGLPTASLGLRPSVSMPSASAITVDGVAVPSGQASAARALALGDTVFSVVVAAAGGATRTYTVAVHRAPRVLQQAYVKASHTRVNNQFGFSVALSGDTLAVGAIGDDSGATGIDGDQSDTSTIWSGAVYIFTRSGGTWMQQAYVKPSNTRLCGQFGFSVALAGDTLAVGAPFEHGGATGIDGDQTSYSSYPNGAVYVFTRTGTEWAQQAYVKASSTGSGTGALFGTRVALDGQTLAVGAPGDASSATGIDGDQTDQSARDSGAVYLFTRTGAVWAQQAYVKASNTGAGDWFGDFLALSGDTLAVTAASESSNATGIDGDQTNDSARNAGAVYVFARSGTTWAQQAYVKASNAEAGDYFGSAVALSGDTLAVGAINESSAATGINGDETGNGALESGAVYVFTRTGTVWRQQAYVKAASTHEDDLFGSSVALSGDVLAVGAQDERGGAPGIDGDDHGPGPVGAVYVFTRRERIWSQRSFVKASNARGDFFGFAVALSNGTLVVGTPEESSNATGIDGNEADTSVYEAGAAYVFTLPF